mmetsp:Transcript_134723/g.430425  ORF Transcript_134723/g.430425 Transcript_134723/m.430425 type:complete len:269 (-) Transcript_134723:6679-7485(-)
MAVSAAETERRNGGCQSASSREVRRLGRQANGEGLQVLVDVVVDLAQVQVRHHGPHVQHAHKLRQTRDAGTALEVADVGLHRTQEKWLLPGGAAQCCLQGTDLDRIAQLGACAVRLQAIQCRGNHSSLRQSLQDDGRLRRPVRRCEVGAAAILVERAAGKFRVGRLVSNLHERLGAAALATGIAGGTLVEGLATAEGREHARLAAGDECLRQQQHVDAAYRGHVAAPAAQRRRGGVRGHERRGTSGVHGGARALQAQGIGDAVCRDGR